MRVLCPEGIESNSVIQDRLDDCVLWDQLITKHYFAGRVIEAAYAELAHLQTTISKGKTHSSSSLVHSEG